MAICQQWSSSSDTSQASAFAFFLRSAGRLGRPLAAASPDLLTVTTLPLEFEPNHVHFFQRQLELCRRIITEDTQFSYLLGEDQIGLPPERHRFVEHSRCTARFGEVLMHARDHASSDNDYKLAVHNSQSLLDYVETTLEESNNTLAVRNGLVDDIAGCLSTQTLYQFRQLQLECDASDSDFTPEQLDLELIGRLYYSAISRAESYLTEVGLTFDHTGFTALLALCRASSAMDATSMTSSSYQCMPVLLSKPGARLDAALSNHFNAITAPGRRFFFSPHHGLDLCRPKARSNHLIVAFSSLGNGVVRYEFGGSLAKLNNQMDESFDVLFIADPAQSWFLKDDGGNFGGFAQYESRMKAATKPYKHVSLLGDSMGGSGALTFSHLATESVVAFSPQIDLVRDDHVSRDDMTQLVKDKFKVRLFENAEKAIKNGVTLYVHRGVESSDTQHTDQLMSRLAAKCPHERERLKVIVHSDCEHHQIAVHLKQKGQLLEALSDCFMFNVVM